MTSSTNSTWLAYKCVPYLSQWRRRGGGGGVLRRNPPLLLAYSCIVHTTASSKHPLGYSKLQKKEDKWAWLKIWRAYSSLGATVTLLYRIAGIFGGELNLAVYITTTKLKSAKISYSHIMAIPYPTAKFKSANILVITILG